MTTQTFYIDEICPDYRLNNAGCKARDDVSLILSAMGFSRIAINYDYHARMTSSILSRLRFHFSAARDWEDALSKVDDDSVVILQFPLMHHSIFAKRPFKKAHERGVGFILIIHDLDFIRLGAERDRSYAAKKRIQAEELSLIGLSSVLIVHNDAMKERLVEAHGIDPEKIVPLQIFDYLLPDEDAYATALGPEGPVIIAGNLQRGKADYLYVLPEKPDFNLYGAGFEGTGQRNLHYMGEFSPEELIPNLQGSFGLVWDGPSINTCTGAFGDYLRINNPHKTSLYLASGLPVIVWDQAAVATFIEKHDFGIAVANLSDIPAALASIDDETYERMKRNVKEISEKLRSGFFTKRAIAQARLHSMP